jgi:hypothetical protein
MSARTRTRQPAAANVDNRRREREAEIKLQRQRVRKYVRELDTYIRNVISENDMSLGPPARLCTTEIVGEWWNDCIAGRTKAWVKDVNDFCYKVVESAADIRLKLCVTPVNERRFDYFLNDKHKRVGEVIIRNDAANPITIEIKE